MWAFEAVEHLAGFHSLAGIMPVLPPDEADVANRKAWAVRTGFFLKNGLTDHPAGVATPAAAGSRQIRRPQTADWPSAIDEAAISLDRGRAAGVRSNQ